MNIKTFLFDDDRGVSPVIGVILMVAITVILAAVIAAFVLGLGDTNSTAPNTNFEFDYDESTNELTVTHEGGDSFDPARVEFQVDGSNEVDTAGKFPVAANTGAGDSNSDPIVSNSMDADNTVTAGDSIVLDLTGDESRTNNNDNTADFELDVIFTSEDGGTSSTIGETSGPEA